MNSTNAPQSNQKIAIVGSLGGTTRTPGRDIVEREIDLTHVRAKFEQFLQNLEAIVDVGVPHVGPFELEEVTFSAEITANGDFKLLGVGVGVETKGGVTFTLRQRDAK